MNRAVTHRFAAIFPAAAKNHKPGPAGTRREAAGTRIFTRIATRSDRGPESSGPASSGRPDGPGVSEGGREWERRERTGE